ncbi:MAG TPA: MFS transporter [Bradyrhizobium sp.]|jgi:predicted MFS family arabinose efflux permease|nr:MFS transporter [Bradyrhizobium sp.]
MPGQRWTILAVLFAVRAATGFQFQSVGSASSMLMQDLAMDYSEIGMLLGAYLLPGVIVAFPTGVLGQRFRAKTLGLAGLLLMAVSGVMLGASEGFTGALVARLIGGVGATMVALVATKMTTDWFDSREIVLAMSILQVSWPFGAMLALPIQAHIAQLWGWPAVMISGALCAGAALGAFVFVSEPSEQKQRTVVGRSMLPGGVLVPVLVAGTVFGAMNLACVLFFSYAPLLMVAQGSSSTAAASLTSLAIWFTILAIPSGGYLVHRSGRPIAAIVVCSLIAAAALALFVAAVHPIISCMVFGVFVGPLSGAILSLPSKVLAPRDRTVGFGVFYTCFYALMAVGPLAAGYLQDAWGSPSAALIAGAALLVAGPPLSLAFEFLSKPYRRAELNHDAELHAAVRAGARPVPLTPSAPARSHRAP